MTCLWIKGTCFPNKEGASGTFRILDDVYLRLSTSCSFFP